ncbi:MAG: histidinol-phosphatase HisJ family protein [Lachnospiraceae bacterium]|nr:histidinol-phosphatase HisJ family protein [Lachnospiraceae bacterium]
MYDSHMHSKNSHDGKETLDALCQTAIEKGVKGIAVTDHIDMHSYVRRNAWVTLKQSIADIREAREKYKGQLEVFCGVELGGFPYDREMGEKVLALTDYDVIIGTAHYISRGRFAEAYSKEKYDRESISDEEIIAFLGDYFDEMLDIVESFHFHTLAHLTCPLRYINGIYHRGIDVMIYEDKIRLVLQKMIEKGIALEVNTSGYSEKYGYMFYPDREVLQLYKKLGGELITLGSDAHVCKNIGMGFDAAKKLLKSIGFDEYCYFEKGQAKRVAITE